VPDGNKNGVAGQFLRFSWDTQEISKFAEICTAIVDELLMLLETKIGMKL